MFERFTERARHVLVVAQQEARSLNHNFIGTEHILLGLVAEGEGVAAQVLEALGVRLDTVQEKVRETVGASVETPTGSPPFTPRAKKVLELSLREALQLGHNYIGTEHMLLGLVREGEGVGARVLEQLGVSLDRARHIVLDLVKGPQAGRGQELRFSEATEALTALTALTAAAAPEGAPRCSRCRASLSTSARYLTINVLPAPDEPAAQAMLMFPVVYCLQCGTAIGSSPSGASTLTSGAATAVARPAREREPTPPRGVRSLPTEAMVPVALEDVPAASRVELTWTERRILEGHAGEAQVQLLGEWSREGTLEGTWLDEPLTASWQVGPPGPNRGPSGHLRGSFGSRSAELHASFHLGPGSLLERAEVSGYVGDQELEAKVARAEGAFGSTGTIVVEGRQEETAFGVFVGLTGDMSRAGTRGTCGGAPVRLDATRDHHGAPVRVTGEYSGPPELLALFVCATLYFM